MRNLKKKLVLCTTIIALFFGAFNANAQKVELGLRFMPTFSSFKIFTPDEGRVKGDFSFGYGFGGFVGFNFTEHIGVQGEIIYSAIAQKYKEQDVEREIDLKYINIPLLLSINTGKTKMVNLNVVAGPQIGISVGSDIQTSDDGDGTNNTEAVLSVKKGDLGFAYGAGLDFGLNPSRTFRLGVGFRGVAGLIDISDNSTTVVTNSYYVLDKTHVMTYSGYVGLSWLL